MQTIIEAALPFMAFLLLALLWLLYHAYLASPWGSVATKGPQQPGSATSLSPAATMPAADDGGGGDIISGGSIGSDGGGIFRRGISRLPLRWRSFNASMSSNAQTDWAPPGSTPGSVRPMLSLGTKMLISALAVTFYYYESEVGSRLGYRIIGSDLGLGLGFYYY